MALVYRSDDQNYPSPNTGVQNVRHLYRYMDSVGDGSGDESFIGDYSSAAEEALLIPASNEIIKVARLIISAEDTSGMTAAKYGNMAALTNGVTIQKKNTTGVVTDITDGVAIKTNAQYSALCYDADIKTWGQGNELLTARFTLSKSGEPVILNGSLGEYLVVNLNDNFDGLISHKFMAQGTYV